MISSKKEYLEYVEADRNALGVSNSLQARVVRRIYPDFIWSFQRRLRRLEYFRNCKRGRFFGRIVYTLLKMRWVRDSARLGFSIPENVFGPGLAIVHYGTIVVNGNARVGKNCRIHACTNIGASGGSRRAPQLGDNVYIGPGAKIYGDIILADNIAVGANATVNKSFSQKGIVIAGSPAQQIKEIDITKIIPNAE